MFHQAGTNILTKGNVKGYVMSQTQLCIRMGKIQFLTTVVHEAKKLDILTSVV